MTLNCALSNVITLIILGGISHVKGLGACQKFHKEPLER